MPLSSVVLPFLCSFTVPSLAACLPHWHAPFLQSLLPHQQLPQVPLSLSLSTPASPKTSISLTHTCLPFTLFSLTRPSHTHLFHPPVSSTHLSRRHIYFIRTSTQLNTCRVHTPVAPSVSETYDTDTSVSFTHTCVPQIHDSTYTYISPNTRVAHIRDLNHIQLSPISQPYICTPNTPISPIHLPHPLTCLPHLTCLAHIPVAPTLSFSLPHTSLAYTPISSKVLFHQHSCLSL